MDARAATDVCGSSVRRSRVVLMSRCWHYVGGKCPADDGGKRAVLREEHEVSRKAIAQGRPECCRCPVCSCAVLFAQIARGTAGAASTRSSLRPLFFGRANEDANLGRNAPRDREAVSTSLRAKRSNPSLRLPRRGLLRCARNDGEGTVPNPGYPATALALPLPCKSLKFKIYAERSSWRPDRCPHCRVPLMRSSPAAGGALDWR